jgi:UDP-glucuronate 4-epimerase
MRILITGVAGFIGYFTAEALLDRGHVIMGFDNLNAYYDPALKAARLARLEPRTAFSFRRADLEDEAAIEAVFSAFRPERVIHLAAQAGVRHSIEAPRAYVSANVLGFLNILEACRWSGVEHLIFASSSSVYGLNSKLPFSESDRTDHPASLYGATKKAGELMAHAYAHLYRLPITGLRFFTVYGPWGRPDMAPFLFTKNILEGRPIDIYNHGRHVRDFTYIDDIVEGIVRVFDRIPSPADVTQAPLQIYNIGGNRPVPLLDFIAAIENATGRKAIANLLPMQQGDALETYADMGALSLDTGFEPSTPLETGVKKLVSWYRDHYICNQSKEAGDESQCL